MVVYNFIYITGDLPSVIAGLTPPAVFSSAFNEIPLRDKAVTPLNEGRTTVSNYGGGEQRSRSAIPGHAWLSFFLHFPFPPHFWLRETNILHFGQYFAFL